MTEVLPLAEGENLFNFHYFCFLSEEKSLINAHSPTFTTNFLENQCNFSNNYLIQMLSGSF